MFNFVSKQAFLELLSVNYWPSTDYMLFSTWSNCSMYKRPWKCSRYATWTSQKMVNKQTNKLTDKSNTAPLLLMWAQGNDYFNQCRNKAKQTSILNSKFNSDMESSFLDWMDTIYELHGWYGLPIKTTVIMGEGEKRGRYWIRYRFSRIHEAREAPWICQQLLNRFLGNKPLYVECFTRDSHPTGVLSY